jgi:hypothetical protein
VTSSVSASPNLHAFHFSREICTKHRSILVYLSSLNVFFDLQCDQFLDRRKPWCVNMGFTHRTCLPTFAVKNCGASDEADSGSCKYPRFERAVANMFSLGLTLQTGLFQQQH